MHSQLLATDQEERISRSIQIHVYVLFKNKINL